MKKRTVKPFFNKACQRLEAMAKAIASDPHVTAHQLGRAAELRRGVAERIHRKRKEAGRA